MFEGGTNVGSCGARSMCGAGSMVSWLVIAKRVLWESGICRAPIEDLFYVG